MDRFKSALGPAMTVVDKSKRWLRLSELEKVRLSHYPLNARRAAELTDQTRQRMRRNGSSSCGNGRRFAYDVLTSLLIGLVQLPALLRYVWPFRYVVDYIMFFDTYYESEVDGIVS